MSESAHDDLIILGKISGVYGVRGWVKIFSHASPKENIFSYNPWLLQIKGQWQEYTRLNGRPQGKGLVAQLEGVTDRDQARLLMGTPIAIRREQLHQLEADEYYWSDLIGLQVVNLQGVELGVVDHLLETGANDVLVLKGDRQRLIPFVLDHFIKEVDLQNKRMVVDWSKDD